MWVFKLYLKTLILEKIQWWVQNLSWFQKNPKGLQCWPLLRDLLELPHIILLSPQNKLEQSKKKIKKSSLQREAGRCNYIFSAVSACKFNSKIQAATHYRREPKLKIWLWAGHFFQHLWKNSSPSGHIASCRAKKTLLIFLNQFLILKDYERNSSAIILEMVPNCWESFWHLVPLLTQKNGGILAQ